MPLDSSRPRSTSFLRDTGTNNMLQVQANVMKSPRTVQALTSPISSLLCGKYVNDNIKQRSILAITFAHNNHSDKTVVNEGKSLIMQRYKVNTRSPADDVKNKTPLSKIYEQNVKRNLLARKQVIEKLANYHIQTDIVKEENKMESMPAASSTKNEVIEMNKSDQSSKANMKRRERPALRPIDINAANHNVVNEEKGAYLKKHFDLDVKKMTFDFKETNIRDNAMNKMKVLETKRRPLQTRNINVNTNAGFGY